MEWKFDGISVNNNAVMEGEERELVQRRCCRLTLHFEAEEEGKNYKMSESISLPYSSDPEEIRKVMSCTLQKIKL